jgi:hypothetical protein
LAAQHAQFSIGVRLIPSIRAAIQAIDAQDWITLRLPQDLDRADRRNDLWRGAWSLAASAP